MQPDDPFAAPASLVADPSGAAEPVSPGVVDSLRRTKGWVRFLAVLGFIGAALSLLMAFVFGAAGVTGASLLEQTPTPTPMPISLTTMFAGYALLMGVAAVIYVFPSWRLLKYASAIARLELAPDGAALEGALEQQRRFWRMVGIMAIVSIALYGLLLMALFGAAVTAGMRGGA